MTPSPLARRRVPAMGIVSVIAVMGLPACGARLTRQQLGAAARSGGGAPVAPAGRATPTTPSEATPGSGAAVAVPGTTGPARTGHTVFSGPGGGATPATCAPDSSGALDPGVGPAEIRLANVSTIGGPVPGLFRGARDGVNAFFAYQNSIGGVCGRKLVLDFADDNLDAAQNRDETQAMIGKDLGFVGSFSVTDEEAASVLGANPAVPDVSEAISKARYPLPSNFSVRPAPPGGWELGPLAYLKSQHPDAAVKMAFFTEDAPAAKDQAAGEMAAAESLGYRFLYTRVTEPTDTDFTADVTNMKNKGVEGVMMAAEAGQMARMAAALKAQDYALTLPIWGANAYDPAFIAQSQGAAEGATIEQTYSLYFGEDATTIPEVALFNSWIKRVRGRGDLFAVYGWESARLIVQALMAAGPKPTRSSVLAFLRSVHHFDSEGMFPPTDVAGKVGPQCWVLIDVRNGAFVRDVATPSGFRCDPGGFYRPSS